MKRWFFLIVILIPILASAREIRYDTIKVSPEDKRNIHQNRRTAYTPEEEEYSSRERANHQPIIFDKSKLRFGANLGLSLSSNYTYLNFGPQAGYQFNNHFMAGMGVKYLYSKAGISDYTRKSNLLGLNIFGYAYPVSFITIFAQPEINYTWSNVTYDTGEKVSTRGFVPAIVAGAGLRLGYTHLTVNYDLLQQSNSPHPEGFYLGVSAFF